MIAPDAAPRVDVLLRAAMERLGGGPDARVDAEVLLAFVLRRDRSWLIAHRDDCLPAESQASFANLVDSRATGTPVAYLTGRRGFWKLELDVGPAVLIPRPETELLVQLAIDRIPPDRPCRIADLGTGSGAIALAIAGERPQCSIVAIDSSRQALRVAAENLRRTGLFNLGFVCGNWLDALRIQECFDLIVSNPPYLATDDAHLLVGDLRFEPRAALVSGRDGLEAIRTIVACSRPQLRPGGQLLVEHGAAQGDAVRSLLTGAGYTGVHTWQDLAGCDRVSGGASAD